MIFALLTKLPSFLSMQFLNQIEIVVVIMDRAAASKIHKNIKINIPKILTRVFAPLI